MEIHQARKILATNIKYPPETANEARIVLDKYNRGEIAFPEDQQGIMYMALQTLMCEGMGDNHRADNKRKDRSAGQKQRKKRTGSRRG